MGLSDQFRVKLCSFCLGPGQHALGSSWTRLGLPPFTASFGEPPVLKGNLADFPLVGVLQMLRNANRTGLLHVTHARGGVVGVEKGKIIHASAALSSGERALSLLSSIDAAPFEFIASTPLERTVDRSTDHLLTDIARDTIAWMDLRERLDWQTIPRWITPPGPMDFERVQVSSLVNGQRTFEMIVQAANIQPRRVAEILLEFCDAGLVRLAMNDTITAEPAELVVSPLFTSQEAIVYVDTALHSNWVASFGPRINASVATSWGTQASFEVKSRADFAGRIQVAEAALRKLRLSRGTSVKVTPSRG